MPILPLDIIEGDAISTSASGAAAQRTRMTVLANNLANKNTTRDAKGDFSVYLRREVLFKTAKINPLKPDEQGVLVHSIVKSPKFEHVYDPDNPEADNRGYRKIPNVKSSRELTQMIEASRAYDANISAMDLYGSAIKKRVQILK